MPGLIHQLAPTGRRLNMNSGTFAHIEVGDGSDTCPSCTGRDWKSARMVVLEGTTFGRGDIDGILDEPGRLSGGAREFLLADRWFSWSKKFDAEFALTTTSALVQEVRKFMVGQASMLQLPPEPEAPQPLLSRERPTLSAWTRITPIEPRRPSVPPELPLLGPPAVKRWYTYFWQDIKFIVGFCLVATVVVWLLDVSWLPEHGRAIDYLKTFQFGAAAAGLGLVSALWTSFGANSRVAAESERKNIQIYEKNRKARERYEKDLTEYQSDFDTYLSDCEKAMEQQREHEAAVKQYYRQVNEDLNLHEQRNAEYRQQVLGFNEQKQRVLVARELLWERARVCMRCGTGYLGTLQYPSSAAALSPG